MRSGLVLGAIALAALTGPTSAQGQAPDSLITTLDSVYTAEEAVRGKATYLRACAECHTMDWYKGDLAKAWDGRSVFGLFQVITTSMPENDPGSLQQREYLDVLAYILELNGLPAGGAPLPAGRPELTSIRFAFPKELR